MTPKENIHPLGLQISNVIWCIVAGNFIQPPPYYFRKIKWSEKFQKTSFNVLEKYFKGVGAMSRLPTQVVSLDILDEAEIGERVGQGRKIWNLSQSQGCGQ